MVSGIIQDSDGSSLTLTGGCYAVESNGRVSVACQDAYQDTYSWYGSVNASHDVISVTQTPYATYPNLNLGALVLTTGSLSDADLTGKWAFDTADGSYGSLTFDGKGGVSAGNWTSVKDKTSGTFLKGSSYSVSADDQVTITLSIADKSSPGGTDTFVLTGALNASKDLFAGDQAADPNDLEKPTLAIMTKETSGFSLLDLFGTWNIASDGMTGSITFNGAGKLTGSYSDYETQNGTLSGTYTVLSTGQATATILASGSATPFKVTGYLNSMKDALAMDVTVPNAQSGPDYLSVLTNPSATQLSVGFGSMTLPNNPAIPGEKGNVNVLVTNLGQVHASGTATITLYLCDEEYGIIQPLGRPLTKQTIALGYEQSKTYTFSNVQLPTNLVLATGTYYLRAVISATLAVPEGNTASGYSVAVPLKYEFGTVSGKSNVSLNLTDSDGTIASFSLTGAATGTITAGPDGWDMDIQNAGPKSRVTIATKKSATPGDNGQIALHDITIESALMGFSGPGVNLSGAMAVEGALGTLTLNNLSDGGITLGGTATDKTAATFNQVSDESLSADGTIASLTAGTWEDADGGTDIVSAAGLTSLTIKKGGLAANLNIGAGGIGSLSVSGGSIRGNISDTGGLGSLRVTGGDISGNISATREGTISVTGGNVSGDITSTATAAQLGRQTGIGTLAISGGDLLGNVTSNGNVGTISVTRSALERAGRERLRRVQTGRRICRA